METSDSHAYQRGMAGLQSRWNFIYYFIVLQDGAELLCILFTAASSDYKLDPSKPTGENSSNIKNVSQMKHLKFQMFAKI